MEKRLRKQELLNIAYKLFITKGYENTSIDEIIKEANIAKGTYYYYFESKEQTLEEVINMMIDQEVEKAKQVLNSELPLEKRLIGIILSFRPNIDEFNLQDVIHMPENIVMHKKINERVIDEATPLLSKVVEEGVKIGLFNCDHIEDRIKLILVMSNQLFDESDNGNKYALIFIDTVEKILGAKPGTLSFIKQLIKE